jgi:glycerol-3-phosphate acyltransferase PlsX
MRIGVDAMGSDHAPESEVRGALAASELLGTGDHIVLVGNQDVIRPRLGAYPGDQSRIEIRHCTQVIEMGESPVEAFRTKPDSSIAVMAQMHKEGQLDAIISAGNTGACVAAASMRLGRLPGVSRPGILIITPTYHGPVAVCDVGANVQPRAQHLHQYGVMSSIYMRSLMGVASPRVGLLSVGEEEGKGNELVKATRELMKGDSSLNFIGNVEGRDLFKGVCDVMVCDGFTGNVVLKLMEGMAEGVVKGMLQEMSANATPEQAKALKAAAMALMNKFDYNEYGGAPLIGVDGICIICHGASDWRGIKNAVRSAYEFARSQLNGQIVKQLEGQGSANA